MKENSLFPNLLCQTKFVYLLHDPKTMLRANVVEEVIPKEYSPIASDMLANVFWSYFSTCWDMLATSS